MERPADHYEQDLLNIVEIVVMVKCRGQMLEDDHQIDWEESVVKRTSTKKSQRSIVNSISTRIWVSISFRFGTASSAISNHLLHLMHSTVFICLYSFFPGEMCIICLLVLACVLPDEGQHSLAKTLQ